MNVRKRFVEPLPDYVEIVQAARWWGVTPMALLDMPIYWYEAGKIVQQAETIIDRHRREASQG